MNARPSVAVQTSPECWETGGLTWEVCGQAQAGFTKGRCWISEAGSPHIPSQETLRVNFKTCSTAHKRPHPPSYTRRPRLNDSVALGWEHIHVLSYTHTHTSRHRAGQKKKLREKTLYFFSLSVLFAQRSTNKYLCQSTFHEFLFVSQALGLCTTTK